MAASANSATVAAGAPRMRFGAWHLSKAPFQLSGTGGTCFESRFRIYTTQAVTYCRLIFPTYRLNLGSYVQMPNLVTLRCAIEDAGVTTPITFGGQLSRVLQPSEGLVATDLFPGLPAVATRILRVSAEVAPGGVVPIGVLRWPSDGSVEQTVFHSGASQAFATGALTGTAYATGGYGPIALIGAKTSQHACLIFGDSIVDYPEQAGDAQGNFGWIALALAAAGIPYCKASRGGNTVFRSTPAQNPVQFRLLKYASHVVINLGMNDLLAGVSLSSIQTDFLSIFSACRAAGCKVYAAKVCPSTTSTNGWADEDHQDYVAGFAPGGNRSQLNAWIDARVADGTIDGTPPVLQYVENPANGKWLAGATGDGVHPGHLGAGDTMPAIMAQAMTSLIATW